MRLAALWLILILVVVVVVLWARLPRVLLRATLRRLGRHAGPRTPADCPHCRGRPLSRPHAPARRRHALGARDGADGARHAAGGPAAHRLYPGGGQHADPRAGVEQVEGGGGAAGEEAGHEPRHRRGREVLAQLGLPRRIEHGSNRKAQALDGIQEMPVQLMLMGGRSVASRWYTRWLSRPLPDSGCWGVKGSRRDGFYGE